MGNIAFISAAEHIFIYDLSAHIQGVKENKRKYYLCIKGNTPGADKLKRKTKKNKVSSAYSLKKNNKLYQFWLHPMCSVELGGKKLRNDAERNNKKYREKSFNKSYGLCWKYVNFIV